VAPQAIEDEEMVKEVPASLLREGVDDPNSMRGRFEKAIRDSQDSIVAAIEEADGTKFHQDAWTRPGGGGGITRVLEVRHPIRLDKHPYLE
jgi:coproporphyrinogen III oxidase